tara:strand:- start:134 stop:250 length:117 start_codon:yes stop_codon:yes gene_type:complete
MKTSFSLEKEMDDFYYDKNGVGVKILSWVYILAVYNGW